MKIRDVGPGTNPSILPEDDIIVLKGFDERPAIEWVETATSNGLRRPPGTSSPIMAIIMVERNPYELSPQAVSRLGWLGASVVPNAQEAINDLKDFAFTFSSVCAAPATGPGKEKADAFWTDLGDLGMSDEQLRHYFLGLPGGDTDLTEE